MRKFFFNYKTKLRESEIRYRRLFESAKDGILILDFETGKIVDANPYIVHIIDHPLDEIIGEKLWEIGLFSNREESKLAFIELKEKGYIRFESMPIQRQNGRITEVEFVSNVYLENNKKVIQCNIRNITERKQIERKQNLTAKILTILNNLDNWNLSIKNILEEIRSYTGIDKIDIHLKGKSGFLLDDTIKTQESFEQDVQYLCKLNENDEIVYDRIEISFIESIFEMVISGKTDSSLNYYTEGGSFYSNNFSGLIEAHNRKQSQDSIIKEIIANECESVAMIPIFAGKEIIGLLQFEDIRPGIFALETIQFFEKTGNSIGVAYIRIQNEDKIKENEQTLIKQNNNYLKLNNEYSKVIEQLNESLKSIQNINIELIDAKEKAAESDRLKSSFLANISHEIRTPLNAIIGFSGFVLDPKLSKEKFESYVQIVNISSLKLLSIISDIIDISKIEVGQITIHSEWVDINHLMIELFLTYKELIDLEQIDFQYSDVHHMDFIQIKTDGSKIKQVLCNLLNNAVKYTSKGEIKFGYTIHSDVEPVVIEFYVKDSGVGIAPENHSIIFERFRQIENVTGKLYGGNGLGLSISKALIERMGGTIAVNSTLGEGSTFVFTIPYLKKIESSANPEPITKQKQKIDWSKKTVLIVEDEINSHSYIEELLSETNINMLHAWGGQKAYNLVKSHSYISLILMDIKMPIVDGYQAMRLIKQIRPDLPIVAQTAYALSHDKSNTLNEGFDDYISKPIGKEELLKLMGKYLN